MRLIGVYDANGGIVGEFGYIVGHLFGVRECALCDITHSPVAKKARWRALEARLAAEHGLPIELLHRNERSEAVREASAGLEPCVLLEHADGALELLLGRDELHALGGDVAAFEHALLAKLPVSGS